MGSAIYNYFRSGPYNQFLQVLSSFGLTWQHFVPQESTPEAVAFAFVFLSRTAFTCSLLQFLAMLLVRYCYIFHWAIIQASIYVI